MQMEVCDADDTALFACGGLWDTQERRYAGPAEECVVVTLAPSQHEAGPEYLEWLGKHCQVRSLVAAGTHTYDEAIDEVWQGGEVFTELWYGGRRAGKSWLACLAVALFAIAVPGARIVMVSPQQKHTQELYEVLLTLLATEWREWQEAKQRFVLVNGTVIELYTGNRQQLKLGKCDLVVVNEAQEQKQRTSKDLMLNTADVGGLAILTANPPRSPIGQWVQDLYNQIKAGERADCRKHFLDWELNPHTSRRKILAEASGMSELEKRREIDGDMDVPVGTMVLSSFGAAQRHRAHPGQLARPRCDHRGVRALVRHGRCAGHGWAGFRPDCRDARPWRRGGFCASWAATSRRPSWWSLLASGGRTEKSASLATDLREWKDDYGRLIFAHPDTTCFVADASGAQQSTYRQRRAGEPHAVDPPSFERLRAGGLEEHRTAGS